MVQLWDPIGWFDAVTEHNPEFFFGNQAGRYCVLYFFGSGGNEQAQKVLKDFVANAEYFDHKKASFFGVSLDPEDKNQKRLTNYPPQFTFFFDFDYGLYQKFGIFPKEKLKVGEVLSFRPTAVILDPRQRVLQIFPLKNAETYASEIMEYLHSLPEFFTDETAWSPAPVLVLPRVFEPELCQHLITLYEKYGGVESGSMNEKDGKVIPVYDNKFKKRKDYTVEDPKIRDAMTIRLTRRLIPEVKKAFQFSVDFFERHIVACYTAEDGGFFRPHRDNTTKGTAHRKFACTINLNAEDYEGGELRFPEFGRQTYRAPTGGAVVFSCSLLHEATPVTKGTRYACLPFLYDAAGEKLRKENLKYFAEYKAPEEEKIEEGQEVG